MEGYEIEPDNIINWGTDYAGYSELEFVAKKLYGLYVERRKHEQPDDHKNAKAYKHKQKKKSRVK